MHFSLELRKLNNISLARAIFLKTSVAFLTATYLLTVLSTREDLPTNPYIERARQCAPTMEIQTIGCLRLVKEKNSNN